MQIWYEFGPLLTGGVSFSIGAEYMDEDFEKLLNFTQLFSYEHDNDREIVIIGCAYLESVVGDILKAYLVDDPKEAKAILDSGVGALSSFVQKARMLYLLGLINKTIFADLKTVAKIRNIFAHNIDVDFSDNNVTDLCKNLSWHRQTMGVPPEEATVRDLYQVGVNQICCYLSGIKAMAHSTKRTMRQ